MSSSYNSFFESDNLISSDSQLIKHSELWKKISEIEHSLRPYEVVSIIFLLHKDAKSARLQVENFVNGVESKLISKLCRESSDDQNWENKFYESLFLIKNYKVLKYFNIEAVNAIHQFNHNYLIPSIRVMLFKICENIIGTDLQSLLTKMGELDQRYADYLELYLLKWIEEGRLSINDNQIQIELLANALEQIGKKNYVQQLFHFDSSSVPKEQKLNNSRQSFDDAYSIIDPNNVGLCIIINQEKFLPDPSNPSITLKERRGTNKDCESLEKMLKGFHFDIEIIHNVPSTHILQNICSKVINLFKPNHSVFMLIILTHGHKGIIFGSDSKPVEITRIDKCLLLPQLQGKPKVIIIQACQGDFYLKASKLETDAPVIDWPKDTLFCMATIPHFVSYRHTEKGSWYIQTLCEIFQNEPEISVNSLLTKLNGKLSNEPVFGSESTIRSQPEFRSRLGKELYFKRVKKIRANK